MYKKNLSLPQTVNAQVVYRIMGVSETEFKTRKLSVDFMEKIKPTLINITHSQVLSTGTR